MITPIFIPMSSSGGSMTPFQLYQLISCIILFVLGSEITDFYFDSLTATVLAFVFCAFLGWLFLPIVALAFLIMCIAAIIQNIKERNN